MPLIAGNTEKLKVLNMGQHILDSLDTPQQLYQVCPSCLTCTPLIQCHVDVTNPYAATTNLRPASALANTDSVSRFYDKY